ncbi:LysR family transcriptional regulator [Gemmatimonas groenlandica]|uniref:LysR family transcriptional regulator n=1 Tax=Gemmatimonas groenlandica TaxID=2732249 RepID=A0A6M4IUS9_9BACT|nr:LysR family transcriptional regulator [Gemmatimonas groenlandica]QJR37236.1 LysR family transcriptional regulator [Gemmatimonas groenlandica]
MDAILLRSFLETADAGTLSRAARQLGISQPSLTGQLQRLETHLGVSLFDRHGRGVTLTDAGKALYPRARRILDEVRDTEDAIRREGADGAGTLSVGAIPTVAPYVLPAAVQRLRARHTAMRVELREDYSAVLARLLLDGALDVVIAALPYSFDHLDTELLGSDALVVAVPAAHAAARAGRITLSQLRDAPAVTLDPAHCLGEQVAGFCSSRQVSPSVVCRSAQLATVLELVGAGVGISIVPAMAAVRHNTPQCAYVPLVDHTLQREIVAVWRRGAAQSAQARAFVECVREVVRLG